MKLSKDTKLHTLLLKCENVMIIKEIMYIYLYVEVLSCVLL